MDRSTRHSLVAKLLRLGLVLFVLVPWEMSALGQIPEEDAGPSRTQPEGNPETPAFRSASATPQPTPPLAGSSLSPGGASVPGDTSPGGLLPEGIGRGLSAGELIAWILGAIVVVLLLLWGRSVLVRLERRRRYQEAAQMDEQPTVDERLLSELTTMPVTLLRGSIPAYYEKIMAMARRLLLSRQILTESDTEPESIIQRLRTTGADPVFTDCVESIVHRCEAVFRGERPDQAAHEKIAKDLKMLVSMRPHGAYGRKDKHADGASDSHRSS